MQTLTYNYLTMVPELPGWLESCAAVHLKEIVKKKAPGEALIKGNWASWHG